MLQNISRWELLESGCSLQGISPVMGLMTATLPNFTLVIPALLLATWYSGLKFWGPYSLLPLLSLLEPRLGSVSGAMIVAGYCFSSHCVG